MTFESGITRVPFGRTENSMCANDAPFRKLSHGQGPGTPLLMGGAKNGVLKFFRSVVYGS